MINDLRLLLLSAPTITAIVGANVHVSGAPANSNPPRIVLHQMGSDEQNDLTASGDARMVELDVDCEGATAQDAYSLAAAARLFLKDYAGPAGAITIAAIVLDDEHEKKVEKTTTPNHTKQFAVTLPIEVFYSP